MEKEDLIKIIPREKEKPSKTEKVLIYTSLIILLILIGGFFIERSYVSRLKERESKVQDKIHSVDAQINKTGGLSQINTTAKKVTIFSDLLKNHKIASAFLEVLKSVCLPETQITSLVLRPSEGTAEITGKSLSFPSLIQQISVLRQSKDIDETVLSSLSLDNTGMVIFSLKLKVVPNVFSVNQ